MDVVFNFLVFIMKRGDVIIYSFRKIIKRLKYNFFWYRDLKEFFFIGFW